MEMKQGVMDVLVTALRQDQGFVQGIVGDLDEAFQAKVLAVFENAACWGKKKSGHLRAWEGYMPSVFQAFCRKGWQLEGLKPGPKAKKPKKPTVQAFEAFESALHAVEEETRARIHEYFQHLESELENCHGFLAIPGASDFMEEIHRVRDEILTQVPDLFEQLGTGKTGLASIQSRAT
ncbi:hypothetical protein LTR78_007240 [Recurvomyces mirabilis]|uniref:Uncharacterized protein n=1 Tax=Recurvomyces mirabilis TaxID=574656 RepID=A0AAE1BYQ0_9PEZI|nr:hypothetical protein LTR78_007240 [Recurvomyces mirabilis]